MAPPQPTRRSGELSLRGWAEEAEAGYNIAKALAPTAFVPEHLRIYANPEERNPARRTLDYEATVHQVAAVLLAGQELELPPMASLRAFVVIRGTVALYAITARALLQARGHEIVVVESTSQRAIVRGRRADSDIWQEGSYDLPRARAAGLYPGDPRGNWARHTKAMLVARATAEVARWVASDALLALPVMVEELEEAPEGQALYAVLEAPQAPQAEADGQADEPAAPPRRRRASRARAALPAGQPAGAAEPPAAPGPPAPEPPSPAPVPEPRTEEHRPSKKQLERLHAGLKDIGITGRDEGLALINAWISPGHVESTTQLAPAEISTVLDRLTALLSISAQHSEQASEQDSGEAGLPEDPPEQTPEGDDTDA
jgi:hypothetical protein